MRRVFPVVLALAALALLLPGIAVAQGGSPGVVLTDRYVLNAGQVVDGDLLVAAQAITLSAGSHITGDVVLVGESVIVRGQIDGNLAVLSDSIVVGSRAAVGGDASLCADNINADDRAAFSGSFSANCAHISEALGEVAPLALDPSRWTYGHFDPSAWNLEALRHVTAPLTPAQRLGFGVTWALAIGALAALYALIFPQSLRRISEAALSAPFSSGGIGLLSVMLLVALTGMVIVSLILVIPIILLPVVFLLWLGLALLMLIGWVGLSLPVGTWVLERLGVQRASPMAAAALGATLLTLIVNLPGITDLGGLVACGVGVIVGSWGLGAVILTQLGRQRYPVAPATSDPARLAS